MGNRIVGYTLYKSYIIFAHSITISIATSQCMEQSELYLLKFRVRTNDYYASICMIVSQLDHEVISLLKYPLTHY